jgi:hypothetical protein
MPTGLPFYGTVAMGFDSMMIRIALFLGLTFCASGFAEPLKLENYHVFSALYESAGHQALVGVIELFAQNLRYAYQVVQEEPGLMSDSESAFLLGTHVGLYGALAANGAAAAVLTGLDFYSRKTANPELKILPSEKLSELAKITQFKTHMISFTNLTDEDPRLTFSLIFDCVFQSLGQVQRIQ